MPAIIEKRDGRMTVLVHLTLRPGRDDVLIQLIKEAPHGSLASIIREVMRNGIRLDEQELFEISDEDLDFGGLDLFILRPEQPLEFFPHSLSQLGYLVEL